MRPLRWIRAHPWKTAAIALLLVMVADYNLASYADKRIRARDADFQENLKRLDWNGPERQNCKDSYELLLYYYKTCFRINTADKPPVGRYLYLRPISYTIFPFLFRDLYFSPGENEYMKILIEFNKDGSIKRRRNENGR